MAATSDSEAVRAARSPAVWRLLGWYMRWYAHGRFHAIRVARDGMPAAAAEGPVVIYANHPSWWDPILFILLAGRLFPARESYGPMDQAALGRYGVFRKMGVFGIEPDSKRGAARFLRVAGGLLSRPMTALWITAEGHFSDARIRPRRLRPGVAHLARRGGPGTVLPLALEYPFWDERTPEALVRFGAPMAFDPERSVADWEALLEARLTETMDGLAALAVTRDPARFATLYRGTAGVGGIYDRYRRVRAWRRGERPQLAHSDAAGGEA